MMGWSRPRPAPAALMWALAAALVAPGRAADAPPSPPEAAPRGEAKADRASLLALPGEEPPQPFIPSHPRTVADRQQVEALSEYCAARALEERRAWTEAIDLLAKARRLEPDSVAILRRLSRLCFALGRTEQAIQYGREVLASDPGDTETLSRLVAHYERKKEAKGAEAAESLLKEVLGNPRLDKNSPGHLLAEYELGKLYAGKLQKMDKAAAAFAQVVEALDEKAANRLSPADQRRVLGSDPAVAYLEFGAVFLAAKRDELAIKAFQRGLVYEPDHPQLTLLLAQTLLRTGQGEQALALVEHYIKLQPLGNDSYELLAKILTALHREGEITPRLEEAAKADSKNVPLQYALADRYRETGQVEKAEKKYEELLHSQPTPQGYAALIASLVKRKRTEELLKVATEALGKPQVGPAIAGQLNVVAADPAYSDQVLDAGLKLLSADPPGLEKPAYDVLAFIARRAGKSEKLVPIQRLKVGRDPSPIAYQELAGTLSVLGKFDEAADVLQELMTKFPDERNARVLVELGRVQRAAGKNDAAVGAVREALKREPNDGEARAILIVLLGQTGKFDEAVQLAREALKNDPTNADFNRLLGGTLTQYGKNDEAIAFYKGLLERYPDNEELVRLAHSGLSSVYVNQGDFAKGEAELETLWERSPDEPGINNDLGYLYADHGKNLEKAEAMIRKAVQEEPENAAYLDSLGWVLFKRGKAKEAVEQLEKAVKNLPGGDATIYEHLGDVYFQLREAAKAKAAWVKAEETGKKAVPPEKRLPEIRKKLESLEKLGATPRPATDDTP